MDPNHNMYTNMGLPMNMSPNASFNSSGEFTNTANFTTYQNLTPEQLLQLQQINQQQIQALSAQLAQAQMLGSPVTSDPYMANYQVPTLPTGVPVSLNSSTPNSPRIGAAMMPVASPVAPLSPIIGHVPVNSSINLAINGQVPTLQHNSNNTAATYNQMAYPNTSAGINTQLPNQIHVQPNQTGQYKTNAVRNVTAPDTLHLQHTNLPRGTSYSSSSYSSSPASTPHDSPAMPKKPPAVDPQANGPTFMHRPRQRPSSPPPVRPPSDRGSTSSASIPGSPGSSGNPPLSPDGSWSDTSGPLSPDSTAKKLLNGDVRSPITPIKNKPLQMQTKYPQDKCYTCHKRVYPMEKLGPVRDVVYHKGCFRCKTCNTQLHLKNFFHSQTEDFDLSVYCKSHQPLPAKGSNLADSVEIKSALGVPKKGNVIPESERSPVHRYSYDIMCREIEHARKAPVADLQPGVKVTRNNAWSKSKRENYNSTPTNLVRADDPVSEYNEDEYNRHKIENEPDYT